MSALAFDASALVTWVLQEQRWRAVDALLRRPGVALVMPGTVLTEVIDVARRKGNTSSADELALALRGQGLVCQPAEADDMVNAAALLELSRAHPGPARPGRPAATLSLGDALALAVVERLGLPVVTRDRYWHAFARAGHTSAAILAF